MSPLHEYVQAQMVREGELKSGELLGALGEWPLHWGFFGVYSYHVQFQSTEGGDELEGVTVFALQIYGGEILIDSVLGSREDGKYQIFATILDNLGIPRFQG